MLVDCYTLEVYLPHEYTTSTYRGTPYYAVLGTRIKYLAVGNMRFFKTQKEVDNPENVKSYPLGIPMLIMSEPSEIEVRDIRLSKGGKLRKCVVLTYKKGDAFMVNSETIKSSDAMMMLLFRLEQGKLDHLPPEVVVQILRDCETMNGISLRIPSEEMEIFVAERYRDPSHPSRKYRFHTENVDQDNMISHNMRTDAIQGTTYQAVMHEDINNALIASINRHDSGIIDEPTTMEAVVRGLDMEKLKAEDYGD